LEISLATKSNLLNIYAAVADCFYDIVDDGTPKEAMNGYVDVENDIWLKAGTVGFFLLKQFNERIYEGHPFIYSNRRRHSSDAVNSALRWFDKFGPSSYTSIITNVPACKRYALLSAMKAGFKKTGVYKDAFLKNGKYYDMHLLQRMRKT